MATRWLNGTQNLTPAGFLWEQHLGQFCFGKKLLGQFFF